MKELTNESRTTDSSGIACISAVEVRSAGQQAATIGPSIPGYFMGAGRERLSYECDHLSSRHVEARKGPVGGLRPAELAIGDAGRLTAAARIGQLIIRKGSRCLRDNGSTNGSLAPFRTRATMSVEEDHPPALPSSEYSWLYRTSPVVIPSMVVPSDSCPAPKFSTSVIPLGQDRVPPRFWDWAITFGPRRPVPGRAATTRRNCPLYISQIPCRRYSAPTG